MIIMKEYVISRITHYRKHASYYIPSREKIMFMKKGDAVI